MSTPESNPFASPTASSGPPATDPTATASWARPYATAVDRAAWTRRFAWGYLVFLVIGWITSAIVLSELQGLVGEGYTFEMYQMIEMTPAENAEMVLGIVQLLLVVGMSISYFMWVHRTYRNLPALGATGLRFSPGWAVAYYFIPIISLFRPYQAMKETWQASGSEWNGTTPDAWSSLAAPTLLPIWWTAMIADDVLGQATFRLTMGAESMGEMIGAQILGLISDVVSLVAVLLMLRVMARVQARQEARRARLVSASNQPAPAMPF